MCLRELTSSLSLCSIVHVRHRATSRHIVWRPSAKLTPSVHAGNYRTAKKASMLKTGFCMHAIMYLCKCAYLCVHACLHVHVDVCSLCHTGTCSDNVLYVLFVMYSVVYAVKGCVCLCMHVCTHAYLSKKTACNSCMCYMYTYVHTYSLTFSLIYLHVHLHTCLLACLHTYRHIHR